MPVLVCCDCAVEFDWDESPSDERCAFCAAARAAHFDNDGVT